MIIKKVKNLTGMAAVTAMITCALFSCNSEPTDKTKDTDTLLTTETKTSKEPNIFYSVPSPIQLGQLLQ
jgi:hypothetical protein